LLRVFQHVAGPVISTSSASQREDTVSQPRFGVPWAEFCETARAQWPLVFRLPDDRMACLESWTPDALKAAIGEAKVTVSVSDSGHYRFLPSGVPVQQRVMRGVRFTDAAELIVRSSGEQTYYINAWGLDDRFSRLHDQIPYGKQATALTPRLWFGSAGTRAELHFHWGDNVFCQTFGSKQFTLFAPSDSQYLYQFPIDSPISHFSHVDVERPDLERYPAFSSAMPIKVILTPGDVLFLPAGWWHHVRSLSLSVSVNQWWEWTPRDFYTPTGEHALRYHYRLYLDEGLRSKTMKHGVLFDVGSIDAAAWAQAAAEMISSNQTSAILVAEFARIRRSAPGAAAAMSPERLPVWTDLVSRASQSHVVPTEAETREAQLCIEEIRADLPLLARA
jgi:hypothetical protein